MSETLNAQDIAKKLQEQLTSLSATVDTHEVSTVDEVGDGIARVSGLKSAMAGELLEFKSSDTGETVFGLAQNLDRDEVGAVLFGAVDSIKEGDECRTTGRIMDIPVSRAMLGRVVNRSASPSTAWATSSPRTVVPLSSRPPASSTVPRCASRFRPACWPSTPWCLLVAVSESSSLATVRPVRPPSPSTLSSTSAARAWSASMSPSARRPPRLPTSARPSLSTVRSTTPSSFRQPLPIPPLCSTSRLWPVPLSASSSCTTARMASPLARPTPAATCSSSTMTCPSRPWPTVRCR